MLDCHVNRDERHLSITKYIQETISDYNVYSLNMQIASIFVSNPRGLHIILKDEEGKELQKFINGKKINVIAHSSYVAYLWSNKTSEQKNKYLSFVLKELKVCKNYNISGLVIHLPKENILTQKHIKKTMKKLLIGAVTGGTKIRAATPTDAAPTDVDTTDVDTTSPIIYLETPAIKPMFANYDTVDKLSKLFHIIHDISVEAGAKSPFGLCIDTAHIWTSGNDISTYEGAKRWFSGLMDAPYIPYDKIIIHLNDSERELGRGPDKHASLTHGKIWNKYKTRGELKHSGLYFIIEFAKQYSIPLILERKNKEMLNEDYAVLKKLICRCVDVAVTA